MSTSPNLHPDGVHHIAFIAGDMKKQLTFFTQVLGFPLTGMFEMHGVEGAAHAFLRMANDSLFSLVYIPEGAEIPSTIGVTHAGRGENPSAPGTMQHIAFRVPDEAALLEMRDRVRSHGIPVFGPIDHGFCRSLYFAGPENMTLEVTMQYRQLDPRLWVDPQTMARLGIDETETAAMIAPEGYAGPAGVPQPDYDPEVPHLHYPEPQYRAMLKTPDSVFAALPAYQPPVEAV